MSEHPTPEEIHGLWRGDISADQTRSVVRHLIRGCTRCRAELEPYLGALLGLEAQHGGAVEDDGYDTAIDRALTAVGTPNAGHAQRPGTAVGQVLTMLASPKSSLPVPERRRPSGLAGLDALLEQARALRYEDPPRMVELARLAAMAADQLDTERYGQRQVASFRSRAWMELANAYRVADRLDKAEEALEHAASLFLASTREDLLGARLLEIHASLLADSRRIEDALKPLDVVHPARGLPATCQP